MKFKIDENTKQNTISLIITGIVLISFYYIIKNATILMDYLNLTISILMPFILGFALAFLLKPLVFKVDVFLEKIHCPKRFIRLLSTIVAFIVMFTCLYAFFATILPQIGLSLKGLYDNASAYSVELTAFLDNLINSDVFDPEFVNYLTQYIDQFIAFIGTQITDFIPKLFDFSITLSSNIINTFVALAIAVYLLLDNERFHRQARKVIYAFVPLKTANSLMEASQLSSTIFSSFIIGKAIDSTIIGIICFIGMNLLSLPYALLISVIVGITNMIPVFGPFIGAVPGIFILLIVDPIYVVWFCLFILALQQFDGNILGPYILGNSLNLPSLWIMFAIIVGGGLFGVLGMFLGVPLFAFIYTLLKDHIDKKLKRKNIEV